MATNEESHLEEPEPEQVHIHRPHCDHGTYWFAHCWACDQEGRARCTDCEESR